MNHSAKLSTPFSCFITGTDTHVGKTRVSAALLHKWVQAGHTVAGMKPVAAGAVWKDKAWCSEDTDLLIQAGNVRAAYATHTPYLWPEPVAPHIAAYEANCEMTLAPIVSSYQQLAARAQAVVVEGVGGFRVPLSDTLDTADLAQALSLPVILVVGLKLGCINHALLTVDAIAACGLTLTGWVPCASALVRLCWASFRICPSRHRRLWPQLCMGEIFSLSALGEPLNNSPRRMHLRIRAVCCVANPRDSYGYRCGLGGCGRSFAWVRCSGYLSQQ